MKGYTMIKWLMLVVIFVTMISCGSEKAITERRGLMMPTTSENPRNAKKYVEVNYSKRDKAISKKQKKMKKMSQKSRNKRKKYK